MSLLSNPVIQGLLGGGPNAIRAQYDQQRAAMAPRAGGGMMGAPGPIVMQDRSMSELGGGLAGLGEGLAAIGQVREKAAAKEAEDAAIQTYLDSVPPGPMRDKIAAMAAVPRGREILMAGLAKQAFPDAADPLKAADLVQIQTPEGPRFVRAGDAIGKAPVGKEQAGDKIKLWFGDKSVEVTPGSPLEDRYRKAGFKETPTLRDGNEDASFKNEKDLRGEFIQINKDFRGVADQFGRVETAVTKPSPANDIALVFSYMKMLDPTSVVRENEQATVQNAGGVPARIRAQWNALLEGEKFTPQLRRDFYESARQLYARKSEDYKQDVAYYTDLARRNNLNPENVVRDIYREPRGFPEQQTTPPSQTAAATEAPVTSEDRAALGGPGAAEAATPLSPEQTAFKALSPRRQAAILNSLPRDQRASFLDQLTPAQLQELRNELMRSPQ